VNRSERFLRRLEIAGPLGVCLSEVIPSDAYTMRNACATARRQGHKIRSERCHEHQHKAAVSRYFLEGAYGEWVEPVAGGSPLTQGAGATSRGAPAPLDLFPLVSRRLGHGI
jgi:hypothetical protein